jgi:outer membrane protein OmpA-like peptidoglycan-associated protein
MRRVGVWVGVALAAAVTVRPASAIGDGPTVYVSPFVGSGVWSDDIAVRNQLIYGARLGLTVFPWLGLEGTYGVSDTEAELPTPFETRMQHVGVDVVASITPAQRVTPYVLAGWAQLEYDSEDANDVIGGTPYTFDGFEVGAGLRVNAFEGDRVSLAVRLDARDVVTDLTQWFPPNRDPDDTSYGDTDHHSVLFSIGLQVAFGASSKDSDGDGVIDKRDACRATPLGAIVDARGCPLDGDGDQIPDGLDECPETPRGAVVDDTGCPRDADGDGILDGLDRCERTPAGARVDAAGCPIDGDGDAIYDGIDRCPGTPPGARVDDAGCPLDGDGDGVFDGIDVCPNTPKNLKVDATGCPIEITETETELLNTGMIRTSAIRFASGSWEITEDSYETLNEIGGTLVQWPQLRIEIGGHTDSQGAEADNQSLSEKRAQAVLDYLLTNYPAIRGEQFSVKGYGESQAITNNDTEVGRSLNRRVEFKVLNAETLRKEIERRRLLER